MNKIYTNPGGMLYMGKISNSCGYIHSNTYTWLNFISLYRKKLEDIAHSNYAHDEETIVHLICKEHPTLFDIIDPTDVSNPVTSLVL